MVAEGHRLAKLVDKVIDLADMESGSAAFDLAPMDLDRAAGAAVSAMRAAAAAKGLTLVFEAEDGPYAITGDQGRLTAAISHLLENAVAFTAAGTVTCRVRRTESGAAVDVIDTGRGIAPEDQKTIFETFRQLGDHLTDKPHGTGLGLAIARATARAHGGLVTVRSTPGHGSVFTLTVAYTTDIPLDPRSEGY